MDKSVQTSVVYFIVAWLPGPVPGDDVKRVVMDSEGKQVLHFGTYQEAWDFFVDNMTPDWEAIVIPMNTVQMHTMDEAVVSLTSK